MKGRVMDTIRAYRRFLTIVLTPILLCPIIPLYEQIGLTPKACNCLYMLLLMAVYWCTEVVNLAITAFVPLVLAPLMGILEADVVCLNYFKDKVALFMGTLIIAAAIQHTGLHRRIALTFIKLFGTNPRLLLLGFMVPTWFLSMWISNSATSVMMMSILNCVIEEFRTDTKTASDSDDIELKGQETSAATDPISDNNITADSTTDGKTTEQTKITPAATRFQATAKSLCLAVCYSATCGGVATLTGTGTNLVCYDNIVEVGERLHYDFGVTLPLWIGFALPISLILLLICWLWLQLLFIGFRKSQETTEDRKRIAQVINKEYSSLGSINWQEGITLVHFILLVVFWLSRDPGKAGGWGQYFPDGFVSDATPAMLIAISLLVVPKYPPMMFRLSSSRPFEHLMSWKDMSTKLNWGVLFLIAGGFGLADCVNKSGLAAAVGNSLQFVSALPAWAMVLIICTITALITEFTSNVVITSLMQPILADIAITGGIHPLLLMIPSCVASSFAFSLPVATPPNAVVYSAGVLKIKDMVKAGAFLNVVAILVVLLASMTWIPAILDFDSFTYTNYTTTAIGNLTTEV